MKEKIIFNCSLILKCDISLLNSKIDDLPNENEREKKNIYDNYYSFIKNPYCIDFIEKIYNILDSHKAIKEKDLTNLSIIILKSFLDRKIVGSLGESYINSDDILNYIVEQYRFYLIIDKKYMPKKSISTLCLYFLDILVNMKAIKQKIILISSTPHIKTIKYYSIEELYYDKNINDYMLFSYKPYELIEMDDEYLITTGHYSKTSELYRKNFNSDKRFNLKNIGYIMNKINVKLYVNNEYQKILNNKLNINIKESKEKIKKNIILLNSLYDEINWTINTKKQISLLQSENSEILDLIIYFFFSEYKFRDNYIFFPIFLDFRGRKYYYSKIGPTSSKILRPAYFYGWYDEKDFNENNNIYSVKYYELINNFCEKKKILNNKKYYEAYFWLLIGIGKFFIDKNLYPITVEVFLESAIANYDNIYTLKLEDYLEVIHYIKIMEQMNDIKIKKRIIIKDATASLNQIFMKKLGPLDQYSMNYVNLGEKWEWYDTYLITRDLFHKTIIINSEYEKYHNKNLFNLLLSRSLIKNMVMIIPYSAGDDLCLENYKKEIINRKEKIIIDSSLRKLLKKFFKFIRYDMQKFYLYNKTSTSLINKMSEDFETWRKYVLESDTGKADLSYYKMKKSSIDKKYKINGENKRVTKLILTPSEALDKKSFDTAIGANVVHFLDADEIRTLEIALGYSIITIHDSYLIDFNNCSNLTHLKINHYQTEINKIVPGYNINNIFILI